MLIPSPSAEGLPLRRAEAFSGQSEGSGLGHDNSNPAIVRPEHRECKRGASNRLHTLREW
jgi:hypothetical protein